jgi:4-hydroxy-tetrahydrodipicolinate reductase
VREDALGVGRRLKPLARPVEEAGAEARFEAREATAQRRGVEAEVRRGSVELLLAEEREEQPHVVPRHRGRTLGASHRAVMGRGPAWVKRLAREESPRHHRAMIRICVAGVTGWTGSAVTKRLLASQERFTVTGAVARRAAGADVGEALGLPRAGVRVAATVAEALETPTDVFIEYAGAEVVKRHVLAALAQGARVVVGSSGLTGEDYVEIGGEATRRGLGVIACGNFSITAALAKHFALLAARHLPTWEIVDYASEGKRDAPSGTTRELAEQLAEVAASRVAVPIAETLGPREARGATVGGAQVHSVRLPGYTLAFEALFGLPGERLVIRHDSDSTAEPYVAGTLLAATRVMETSGLLRGLDRLLFA